MKLSVVCLCIGAGALVSVSTPAVDTPSPTSPGGLLIPDTLFSAPAIAVAPTTVVAVVEGRQILQKDVDRLINRTLAANAGRIPPDKVNEVRQQLSQRAIEELIIQIVLENEADRQKITVDDAKVEQARKAIPLPPGQTLDEVLSSQGMTVAQLDADLRRGLRIRALFGKAIPETPASETEARTFYDQNPASFQAPEMVAARHILIAVPSNATAAVRSEKRAEAEKIRGELLAGGDFAELAKKHSDDPGSKERGGLYMFGRGQMVPEFENAAFTQKIDEIGPIVETAYGYHIIQTTNRTPARTVGFEEAAPRIREMLERNTRQKALQDYIRKLRESAKVVIPGAAGS